MVVLTASLPPLEETQQRAGASLPDKGGLPGRGQAGPVANQKLAERKSLLVAQQAAWDKKKQARDSSGLNAAGQRARLGAGERPSRTGPRPARWLKQTGVRRPLHSQAAEGASVDARAEAKHRRGGILRTRPLTARKA